MFDNKIKSEAQAKEFFLVMGCSSFYMAREYPKRYKEYKKLNISKQQEDNWRKDKLEEYKNEILENNFDKPLWILHSNMVELLEMLKIDTELKKVLEVTYLIRDRVPQYDRVIVSETINGRKYRQFRSGLIYLAYDLNSISVAKDFIELSLYFSRYKENESRDLTRCENATNLCNDIKRELSL